MGKPNPNKSNRIVKCRGYRTAVITLEKLLDKLESGGQNVDKERESLKLITGNVARLKGIICRNNKGKFNEEE